MRMISNICTDCIFKEDIQSYMGSWPNDKHKYRCKLIGGAGTKKEPVILECVNFKYK